MVRDRETGMNALSCGSTDENPATRTTYEVTMLLPPQQKSQALSAQPLALRDEGALRVLEDELRVWLATCSVPEVSGDPVSRDRLRVYVSRLKETGYLPEGMIVHLKQLFLSFKRQRDDAEARTFAAIQEAVIRTCIKEYFGYRRG